MEIKNKEEFKEYMDKNVESIEAIRETAFLFFKKHCILRNDQTISNKKLYQSYELWCAQHAYRKLSNMEFVAYLHNLGAISKHKKDGGHWIGLAMKTAGVTEEI